MARQGARRPDPWRCTPGSSTDDETGFRHWGSSGWARGVPERHRGTRPHRHLVEKAGSGFSLPAAVEPSRAVAASCRWQVILHRACASCIRCIPSESLSRNPKTGSVSCWKSRSSERTKPSFPYSPQATVIARVVCRITCERPCSRARWMQARASALPAPQPQGGPAGERRNGRQAAAARAARERRPIRQQAGSRTAAAGDVPSRTQVRGGCPR